MPSQIELYEEISLLTSRMVAAARASAWDSLTELEQRIAALRDSLLAAAGNGNAADIAPDSDLARKHSLIQRILEDDAEVRRHTEPWMEHLYQFLGDSTRRRDILKAYAAGAGRTPPGSVG
ncbi:MAG: flagellar protein FliT [Sulfuritalea sp.]|jgi:flagellar protein FliT|nr:flagellar protein FliT [Sulfuritalea sp.]